MADRYLILCEPYAAPHLERYVADRAEGRDVRAATDKRSLRQALFDKPRKTRLIAFCAKTIVPQSVLDLLALTPYNIHPGTPEFPGVHPDAFAHAQGKRRFGATAHEMIALIDAGAIVATADERMPANASRMDFANIGFRRALDLFEFLVDFTLRSDDPLPLLEGAYWRGPYNSEKDYRAQFGDEPPFAPDAAAFVAAA